MNFFIISPQRSGSTLLRSLINSHPNVYIPTEMHVFNRGNLKSLDGHSFYSLCKSNPRMAEWNLDESVVTEDMAETAVSLVKLQSDKRNVIVGDKTPENIDNLESIIEIFPTAKFIFLYRDPLEIVLSLKSRGWQGPFDQSRVRYVQFVSTKMLHFEAKLGNRVLSLHYEKLVDDPAMCMRKVSSFLDVPALPNEPEVVVDITTSEKIGGMHQKLNSPITLQSRRREFDIETVKKLESMINVNSYSVTDHAALIVSRLLNTLPFRLYNLLLKVFKWLQRS